jgi:hypothetical protein
MIYRSLAWGALCAMLSGTAGAVGSVVDISVHDRSEGRALSVYHHDGRHYVVGKPGNEYQIRVRNRAGADVLAVVSVDGVNAVSGETAAWSQTGYVLGAGQAYDIRGWRKSLQRIAAFFFTEHQQSYAARTGRPDNGVAVFRRKLEPQPRILREPASELRREGPFGGPGPGADSAADAAPRTAESAGAARQAPWPGEKAASLGTGHGRSETSRVTYTDFERASATPDEVVAIHYDTYANLVALGVIRPSRVATPAPFPGQFVPDPR